MLDSEADFFVEMRAFEVPKSAGFPDCVKYSLVLVCGEGCILRYDNEQGKGHHRHCNGKESKIEFGSIEDLLKYFFAEADEIRRKLKKGVLK